MENNWKQKNLENLEKDIWKTPNDSSRLVTRCHELRKIPLNSFTNEDLRIMIGQQIGLNYLIPLAIERLSENLFAEGDYYPGDILNNVLKIDQSFWSKNQEYWLKINNLIKERKPELDEKKIDYSHFEKK